MTRCGNSFQHTVSPEARHDALCRRNLCAIEGRWEYPGSARDPRWPDLGCERGRTARTGATNPKLSCFEESDEGRTLRPAGCELHSVDCDGFGGHGRGPDRCPPLLSP